MNEYDSGPYYDPEKHGLRLVGSLDDGDWDFDMFAVWRNESGAWLVGTDSGCSCSSPFDSDWEGELTTYTSVHNVIAAANEWSAGSEWRTIPELDRVAFIERLLAEAYK